VSLHVRYGLEICCLTVSRRYLDLGAQKWGGGQGGSV